jgi:hypothetical protein
VAASGAAPGKKRRARARSAGSGLPSGKSHFPARAGFWGRRDSQGDLVPLTDPALAPLSGRHLGMPDSASRRRLLQNLLVIVISASLSFLAAWTLLEARRPKPVISAPAISAPAAPVTTIPAAAPAPPVVAPVAGAPIPARLLRPARHPHPRPARLDRRRHDDELLSPTP